MYRTLFCNDIGDSHIGKTVQLAGWGDVVRGHGVRGVGGGDAANTRQEQKDAPV